MWHQPLRGHFCPVCLKELVLAEDARNHLHWLLEDTVAAWWAAWGEVGIPQAERVERITQAAHAIAAGLRETEDQPEHKVAA